jgi:hypothetical protein
MVSRRDKVEIENSRLDVSEIEDAVEVEVTVPFVRGFPKQACTGARIFRRCEHPRRPARVRKGEFQ